MSKAIDLLLLTWEPTPSLNEVLAALLLKGSPSPAISATIDAGPTRNQVKKLEDLVADIPRRHAGGRFKPN